MRDDFDQKTKDILFKRARAKCSNPACRRETSLAHSEADQAVNLGEAAHITAASPHGPDMMQACQPKKGNLFTMPFGYVEHVQN